MWLWCELCRERSSYTGTNYSYYPSEVSRERSSYTGTSYSYYHSEVSRERSSYTGTSYSYYPSEISRNDHFMYIYDVSCVEKGPVIWVPVTVIIPQKKVKITTLCVFIISQKWVERFTYTDTSCLHPSEASRKIQLWRHQLQLLSTYLRWDTLYCHRKDSLNLFPINRKLDWTCLEKVQFYWAMLYSQ